MSRNVPKPDAQGPGGAVGTSVALLVATVALGLSLRALRASEDPPAVAPAGIEPPMLVLNQPVDGPTSRWAAIRRWVTIRRVFLILTVPTIAGLALWLGGEVKLNPNLLKDPVVIYGGAAYLTVKALDELVSDLVGTSDFDRAWADMSKFLRLGLAIGAIGFGLGKQLAEHKQEGLWTLAAAVPSLILLACGLMLFRRWRAKATNPESSGVQSSGTPEKASMVA